METLYTVPRKPLGADREAAYSSLAEIDREQPQSYEKSVTSQRIYWRALWIPITLYIVGIVMAVGHHLFLRSLNDEQVHDQVWMGRVSLGIAFIVKTGFCGTVAFTFVQKLWQTLLHVPRGMSIAGIDALFSAVESPHVFFKWDTWRNAFIPMIMLIPLWFLPLIAVVSPTALTVGTLLNSTVKSNCSVPFLNMSLENNSTEFGSLILPSTSGDLLSIYTTEGGWGSASASTKRLVNTVAQNGQLIDWPSPCGTNCTYEIRFNASSWQCAPSNNINPEEAPWVNGTSQACPWVWFPSCGDGSNITISQLSVNLPVYEAALNDTTHRLWVGLWGNWNPPAPTETTNVKEYLDLNVFLCSIVETTYHLGITYVDSRQSIDLIKLEKNAPIHIQNVNEGGSGLQGELAPDIMALVSLYDTMASLFAGSIINDEHGEFTNYDSSIDLIPTFVDYHAESTDSTNTGDSYLPINDLDPLIEELSHNVTISLLSNSRLAVTNTTTTTCISRQALTVWKYHPALLIISYFCGIAVTTLALGVSISSILKSSSVKDNKFSTIIQATRGDDLDGLVSAETTVGLPLSKRVQKTRLRFQNEGTGVFTVDGRERGTFRILG